MNKKIPIFINNRNRLTSTKELIVWLKKLKTPVKIFIIDNNSTYKPLLDYYDQLESDIELIRLKKNTGPFAPWLSGVVDQYTDDNEFYVVTDSDIVPIKKCPFDVLELFKKILSNAPQANKIGFGLNIFDIPDHYDKKWEVIKWELQWWKNPVGNNIYNAAIDTTFALYKKGISTPYYWDTNSTDRDGNSRPTGFLNGIRTGYPYLARHKPWYVNTSKPPAEEVYIREHNEFITHWTKKNK